ncbi:Spo0E family sporulation regulatory protein-aspartic acid phosphatase [Bacillus lacus]|uniref:Spo0E family sporulation regulatory protein-aspartic acid phosphatase n=2 Tax=Metabacillus lacus TaxID=1983721 RepID=A0A7X2LZR2_9BACI|nr:aspartyl-phosphate phosphatase Spo0E family protein [Metabacillus lacus]MRX71989.1 Spo0E family sporulation regulatory protein-aspartic acid phosphatase [Metabacillus lacus]
MYEQRIEEYRESMLQAASKYGYTSKETLAASQHLDKILNLSFKSQEIIPPSKSK